MIRPGLGTKFLPGQLKMEGRLGVKGKRGMQSHQARIFFGVFRVGKPLTPTTKCNLGGYATTGVWVLNLPEQ
jgi:hypothetical protein